MASSALLLGGAYVAGMSINHMNNAKKEQVLQKLQQQKIELLEEKNRWLMIKIQEEKRFRSNQQEIEQLRAKIALEQEAIAQYKTAHNDMHTKFLVILGNTGDGKSTLCNRLVGDRSLFGDAGPFRVSDEQESQTTRVQHIEYREPKSNGSYVVVDTPGINDSEQKDDSHINDMVNYLYGCGGVNAFILVRNGTNNRFDANFQRMLSQYESFFGSEFWNHLIIVLTRIEGNERKKFQIKKKDKQLRDKLHTTFELKDKMKGKVPVFGIGSDCYGETIQNIQNAVSEWDKMECNDLKSPIEELKEELNLLMESMDDFGANLIDDAQENIDRIDREILSVEQSIRNPSQVPLLKSGVKCLNQQLQATLNSTIKGAISTYNSTMQSADNT